MRVGSLFSGIGGFDLGFERAGMHTAWFVEREPYCQGVLARHWPTLPIHEDVCAVGAHNLEPVDLLCGGFPCQDLSYAGKGGGIRAARSGLWAEFHRLIGELRPSYVVVENVSALRRRGLGVVLGDLASLGYDAEWDCIRASDVGAPHPRERLWLVAYPTSGDGSARHLLEASEEWRSPLAIGGLPSLPLAPNWEPRGFWSASEPPSPLLVDGFPGAVAATHALGNALVPQIAEILGHRIMAHEAQR